MQGHKRKFVLAVVAACAHEPAAVTLPAEPGTASALTTTANVVPTDRPRLHDHTDASDLGWGAPPPPSSNCPNINAWAHAAAALRQPGLVGIVVTLQPGAPGTFTTNAPPTVALGDIVGKVQVTATITSVVVKPRAGAFSVELPLTCVSGPGALVVYASLIAGSATIEGPLKGR